MTERVHLETLLTALDASPKALQRDLIRGEGRKGDLVIRGKLGHVYADGPGFLLYVMTDEKHEGVGDGSPRRWNNIKRRLDFCRVKQDGDDEGCLYLDRLPTPIEANLVREALGIRKRTHFSAETVARLRDRFTAPEKRPLAA